MFFCIQENEYSRHAHLLTDMHRLRKRVFFDQLGWSVIVDGDVERDCYDDVGPVYLVWTDDAAKTLYGSVRLMPTTGPSLLFDVFGRTIPDDVNLVAPGIWEATRMCFDEVAIGTDMPEMTLSNAASVMLVAMCECGLTNGIHTMVSNYEPPMKRVYARTGAVFEEIGRADGFGRMPVCCGLFEISEPVLARMRKVAGLTDAIYTQQFQRSRVALAA